MTIPLLPCFGKRTRQLHDDGVDHTATDIGQPVGTLLSGQLFPDELGEPAASWRCTLSKIRGGLCEAEAAQLQEVATETLRDELKVRTSSRRLKKQ